MNRRYLLYGAALFGGGILSFTRPFLTRPVDCMSLSYSDLPEEVRALYHEDFVGALPDKTLEEILMDLYDAEVCTAGGIGIEQVRIRAVDDPLVKFNDMFWTKSELLVYAAVARLHLVSHSRKKRER